MAMETFESRAEAVYWMEDSVDDPCIDNRRFAFEDDPGAMVAFWTKADQGCCGAFDAKVLVGGSDRVRRM